MAEKPPTPIRRGIEIQLEKVTKIRAHASEQFTRIVALGKIVDERIATELAKGPEADNLSKLKELFDQEHALDEVGKELEKRIMHADQFTFDLHEELARIDDFMERVMGIEGGNSVTS